MAKSLQDMKVKKTTKSKRTVHHNVIAKKQYIEFITAFISIPLSITWLLLNLNNIKNINVRPTPTPTPMVNTIIQQIDSPQAKNTGNTDPVMVEKVVEKDACKKGLGPVTIVSPSEGETVTENPVIFTISYDNSTYCSAVWSYRVNGGQWSGYSDTSLGVYNIPEGAVTFELRVKSVVTDDTKTLVRKFIYKAKVTTASSSAR